MLLIILFEFINKNNVFCYNQIHIFFILIKISILIKLIKLLIQQIYVHINKFILYCHNKRLLNRTRILVIVFF